MRGWSTTCYRCATQWNVLLNDQEHPEHYCKGCGHWLCWSSEASKMREWYGPCSECDLVWREKSVRKPSKYLCTREGCRGEISWYPREEIDVDLSVVIKPLKQLEQTLFEVKNDLRLIWQEIQTLKKAESTKEINAQEGAALARIAIRDLALKLAEANLRVPIWTSEDLRGYRISVEVLTPGKERT